MLWLGLKACPMEGEPMPPDIKTKTRREAAPFADRTASTPEKLNLPVFMKVSAWNQ